MDNFLDLVYDKNSPAYTKVTSMLAVIFVSKKEGFDVICFSCKKCYISEVLL